MKLLRKESDGQRTRKVYDRPATPLRRVLDAGAADPSKIGENHPRVRCDLLMRERIRLGVSPYCLTTGRSSWLHKRARVAAAFLPDCFQAAVSEEAAGLGRPVKELSIAERPGDILLGGTGVKQTFIPNWNWTSKPVTVFV